jgi:hypothetical protein
MLEKKREGAGEEQRDSAHKMDDRRRFRGCQWRWLGYAVVGESRDGTRHVITVISRGHVVQWFCDALQIGKFDLEGKKVGMSRDVT